jgi:hypothetical protein
MLLILSSFLKKYIRDATTEQARRSVLSLNVNRTRPSRKEFRENYFHIPLTFVWESSVHGGRNIPRHLYFKRN